MGAINTKIIIFVVKFLPWRIICHMEEDYQKNDGNRQNGSDPVPTHQVYQSIK
jgi:hypothetical protein